MNTLLKLLIILCIEGSLVWITSCDGTIDSIDISCASHGDCKSYEDKLIQSECDESNTCRCSYRRSGTSVNCLPTTKVSIVGRRSMCNFPNTENFDGMCVTSVVSLNKSCDFTKQCLKGDRFSECKNQVCVCKENFIEDEKACRSLVQINECSTDEQCTKNAKCVKDKKKCVCNSGFIASSAKTDCLPIASYNHACVENVQCEIGLGIGSTCENKLCTCNSSYVAVKNDDKEFQCLPKIEIGEYCVNSLDCLVNGSNEMVCNENKCICIQGYKMVGIDGKYACVRRDFYTSPTSSSSLNSLMHFLLVVSLIVSLFSF